MSSSIELTQLERRAQFFLIKAQLGREQIRQAHEALCKLLGCDPEDGSRLSDEIQAMTYDGHGSANELIAMARGNDEQRAQG